MNDRIAALTAALQAAATALRELTNGRDDYRVKCYKAADAAEQAEQVLASTQQGG